jgi:predicted PurR-regulated permease PerM
MPKLNTFQKLIIYIAGLVVLFLNVISYYKGEVADLVSGNFTAPYITPAVDWISQWTALITAIVIIGLVIFGIVNYFRNRHKPDFESDEVKAIKQLTTEIKGMRQDFKERGANNENKQSDNKASNKSNDTPKPQV